MTGWSPSLAHLIVGLAVVLCGWIAAEYFRGARMPPPLWPGDPAGISLVLLCKNQGEVLEYGVRRLRAVLDRVGAVQSQVILVDVGSQDDTEPVALRLAETLGGVDAITCGDRSAGGWAEAVVKAHRKALYPLILCYAPVDACGWEKTCDLIAAFLRAGQKRPTREGNQWHELKR